MLHYRRLRDLVACNNTKGRYHHHHRPDRGYSHRLLGRLGPSSINSLELDTLR